MNVKLSKNINAKISNKKITLKIRKPKCFYRTYKNFFGKKIPVGRVLDKKELEQNDYLRGVSCFVIDKDGNILMEKRGQTKLTSGEYDLCSGHIDNNETPTQAMIREYVEELHNGSEEEKEKARMEAINKLKKLAELDLVFYNKGNKRNFFIQFFCLKTSMNKLSPRREEVDEIVKVPMEKAFEMIRDGKTKFPYDKRYEAIFKDVKEHYNNNRINSFERE